MYLVAGLGNPGPKYVATRHNAGFLVVDRLARRHHATFASPRDGAVTAKVQLGEHALLLVKPVRYMNLSGQPTASLASFYRVSPDRVVVVHDELDLPFGQVRIKVGGGHAGHNGLRDLHTHLGTPNYVRVRVGISRPPPAWDVASYVLSHFTADETPHLQSLVDTAADAVESVVLQGASAAQNHFNTHAGDSRFRVM